MHKRTYSEVVRRAIGFSLLGILLTLFAWQAKPVFLSNLASLRLLEWLEDPGDYERVEDILMVFHRLKRWDISGMRSRFLALRQLTARQVELVTLLEKLKVTVVSGDRTPRFSVSDRGQPSEFPARLIGFELVDHVSAFSREVPVALVWELEGAHDGRREGKFENWEIIREGKRVVQVGLLKNLLENGSFEQTIDMRDSQPRGWPEQQYEPNDRKDLALKVDSRLNTPTVVARLDNLHRDLSSWYSSRVEIQSDRIYMEGGWVRTEGKAKFCFGRGWYPSSKEIYYGYHACRSVPSWELTASSVVPQESANQAQVWLLASGVGSVFFDDVFFAALEIEPVRDFLKEDQNQLRP